MNRRKHNMFKIITVLMIALFSIQCTTFRRGEWISTGEEITTPHFLYRMIKIKEPTVENPTVEYKLMKLSLSYVWEVRKYEKIRQKHSTKSFLCFLGGLLVGGIYGNFAYADEPEGLGQLGGLINSSVLGGILGLIVSPAIKSKASVVLGETIQTRDKIDQLEIASPEPVPNYPITLIIFLGGVKNKVNLKSDEQGIIRLHPTRDLRIPPGSLGKPMRYVITYFFDGNMISFIDEFIIPKGD